MRRKQPPGTNSTEMKRTLILLLMVPLFLGSCHIEKDYDLKSKNIDYEINAGQQIVVPIGSFPTIKIKDLISKPAEEYFDFSDEEYCTFVPDGEALTDFYFGQIEIAGLAFIHLEKAHIPNIRFFMDVKSTLPFEFDVTCNVIDTLGMPVEGVSPMIEAHVYGGSEENPSYSSATLNILSSKELRGVAFDGIRFDLTVKKMPSETVSVKRGCGLAIKNVRLQLPDGINFKIKKNKTSNEE